MNVLSKQDFLSGLIDKTEVITSNTHAFLRLSEDKLNFKPEPQVWSIVEIFSHLNIANTKYIHSILEKIKMAPDAISPYFQSGWMGDWVYEKLMPRSDGSVCKMSSPKFFHPAKNKNASHEVINQFLERQDEIHDILLHVSTKDLARIRVPFYLTGILKFRLGDSLRFLIAHNERHLLQAHRVMEKCLIPQNG